MKAIILRLNPYVLFIFLLSFFCLWPSNQTICQNKDVILVLDESGSMFGAKWESVSYAMQLVTALLDEKDNFYIVRHRLGGLNKIDLSKKQSSINNIQMYNQEARGGHGEVIEQALDQMKKNPGRKKVILFYGDGIWGGVDLPPACQEMVKSYPSLKPDLHFLKVEDNSTSLYDASTFEQEMSALKLLNVLHTNSNNSSELITNLQNISKKMAEVDTRSMAFNLNSNEISFDVKFPLKKVLVLYQKDARSSFPDLKVNKIDADLQSLKVVQTLKMGSAVLKGKFAEVKDNSNGLIKEGQKIKITLSENVNRENILIIPIVAAKLNINVTSAIKKADTKNNEYIVCEDLKSMDFTAFLEDSKGKKIRSITGMTVLGTNGEKEFSFTNGKDEAKGTIPLLGDTTYISVEGKYQGYFHQKGLIFTVIKQRCVPKVDTTTLGLGEVPFVQFNRIGHCVSITYYFNDELVVPKDYSLKVRDLPFGITSTVDSSGNSFIVCFKKSPFMCNCLVPTTTINGTFTATPKHGQFANTNTQKPFRFIILEEPSWYIRWKDCIFWLIRTIIISTYVYGLLIKPRFDRTAKFEVSDVDKMAIYAAPNKKPRKKLANAFVSRYLIPFIPETKVVDGMKIIATPNRSTILIAKESLSEKMSKNGEPVNPKSKKDLRIFRNNTIEVEKTSTITSVYTFKVK